jgi:hypothetical protein
MVDGAKCERSGGISAFDMRRCNRGHRAEGGFQHAAASKTPSHDGWMSHGILTAFSAGALSSCGIVGQSLCHFQIVHVKPLR